MVGYLHVGALGEKKAILFKAPEPIGFDKSHWRLPVAEETTTLHSLFSFNTASVRPDHCRKQ